MPRRKSIASRTRSGPPSAPVSARSCASPSAVTCNAAPTGPGPGDYVNLYGLLGAGASGYEGAYKVLRVTGSILEVAFTGATFGSISTSGWVTK